MNESLKIDEVTLVLEDDHDANQMIRRDDLQLVTRQQETLYEEARHPHTVPASSRARDAVPAGDDYSTLVDVGDVSVQVASAISAGGEEASRGFIDVLESEVDA